MKLLPLFFPYDIGRKLSRTSSNRITGGSELTVDDSEDSGKNCNY